ncbi:MAG: surface-adhesin E family protein [Allosphingosinicella sp.]
MRLRLISALFVAALSTSPAQAADWRQFGQGGSGAIFYYDAGSIVRQGGNARVWVRVDLSGVRTDPAREARELWSFNCNQRTTMVLSVTDYAPDGGIIRSRANRDNGYLYDPVVPDSQAERALRIACGEGG